MNKDYHQIQSIYGKEAADQAYSKDQQDLARVDKAKRDTETMKALAVSMSVIAAVGVGNKAYGHYHPSHSPAPIEKHGDHHGLTPATKPGTGTLYTEGGNFLISQKPSEDKSGIGTAVAVEIHDGHVQAVDPMSFADKK